MDLLKDIVLIGELGELAARRVEALPHWKWFQNQWCYVVGPGQTMWSIAKDLYGSGLRWRDLWVAQSASYRAQRDPSRLVVGDILAMPRDAIERAQVGSMFATGRIHGLGGPGDATDGGGDYVPDIPTVGPIGPQDPTQYSGGESGPSGQAHDSSGGGGGGLVITPTPTPAPGPSPAPGPPKAMISSSALPLVLGAAGVVGVIGAVIYFATK